ncbi:GNAT family N-acetyltransferase [Sporanaerobacter sp. PP17-6a]|uniref:GNAT family N-acetyltransferase n=1 Tax=Sporanaerobacter sp. PP17-6a TaxID=1891289 RepID=UPI0008A03063|nr:GNAT family protein [Sporanaerobacter sp. PP17-6a]SCL87639.1 Spermidine N(1)-acetyltransferase [Sporanaerobacter sp. PP17-6a]
MYFKKIVGQKCYLSPINEEDYEKYTEWVNDMEVAAGLIFASNLIGPEAEKLTLERLSIDGYNFAIIDIKKDELIGNCGFPKLDQLNKAGEVGIFIGNKDYWGKGYGQEVLKLLLDFGFNILNLHNISLKVYSFNQQAIKCYKKVGFKEAGRIRESKFIAGKAYDEIFMDILDKEYESVYINDIVGKKLQK